MAGERRLVPENQAGYVFVGHGCFENQGLAVLPDLPDGSFGRPVFGLLGGLLGLGERLEVAVEVDCARFALVQKTCPTE